MLSSLVIPLIFAAAPPVASSEVSPSQLMPAEAIGGAAQPTAEKSDRYPDPNECEVVVDAIGKVGFRIADAQSLTNRVVKEFRDRIGRGGVVYEGTLISDKKMTKMLNGSESEIRAEKMEYFEAAIAHAKRRVKMKFGKKKGQEFIQLTCRNVGSKKSLDESVVTAATWREAMDKLDAALPAFCLQIAKKAEAPQAQTAPPPKKKKKAWSMPPRRD